MRPTGDEDIPMTDAQIKAMKEKKSETTFGKKEKSILEKSKLWETLALKWGLAVQVFWCKYCCTWNWLIVKTS